jgi:hypothetical protein
MQRGAVPIAKIISTSSGRYIPSSYENIQPRQQVKRKKQNVDQSHSYLDDALIEEDLKNVNRLFNNQPNVPVTQVQ